MFFFSSGLTGRCYTASECGANKGSPNGNCAAGYVIIYLWLTYLDQTSRV